MYKPESGVAEEFIDDQEIKDTIAYADANKDNKELILSIIEKAKKPLAFSFYYFKASKSQ